MDLQRGVCFLCCNVKVVTSEAEIYQIICSLLSNKILNIAKFRSVQSCLKLCPICYHKLLILKRIKNNEASTSEDYVSRGNCLLCKSGTILFKITDWQHFHNISEDLALKDSDIRIICSDCLYYLDVRYEIKTKLFSRYPQLKIKPQDGIANKQKQIVENSVKGTTLVFRNKKRVTGRKKPSTEAINISLEGEENSPKRKNVSFDLLKNLRPLKHNKSLKNHRIVKADYKFLNQVPYVLLKTLHNNKNILEVNGKKICPSGIQTQSNKMISTISRQTYNSELKEKSNKKRQLNSQSMIIKKTRNKRFVIKNLLVNLSRINVSQKQDLDCFENCLENDFEAGKLHDKFDILTEPVKVQIQEDSSNDLDKSKQSKTKLKRKSVSFAEHKNVEIEYVHSHPKTDSFKASSAYISEVPALGDLNRKYKNKIEINTAQNVANDTPNENTKDFEKCTNDENTTESESNVESESHDSKLSRFDIYQANKYGNAENNETQNVTTEQNVEDNAVNQVTQENSNFVSKIPNMPIERVGKEVESVENLNITKNKIVSNIPKTNVSDHLVNTDKDVNISEKIERNETTEKGLYLGNPKSNQDKDTNEIEESEPKDVRESTKLTLQEKDVLNKKTENYEIDRVDNKLTDTTEGSEVNLVDNRRNNENTTENKINENENYKSKVNKCIVDVNEQENRNISASIDSNSEELKGSNENNSSDSRKKDNVIKTFEDRNEMPNTNQHDDPEVSNCLVTKQLTVVGQNMDEVNKESSKEIIKEDQISNENSKMVNDDLSSFSDSEKNEELGITDVDRDNISSILTSFVLQQDQPEDKTLIETDNDAKEGNKRKIGGDALNITMDNKKKKVTFCEDFT